MPVLSLYDGFFQLGYVTRDIDKAIPAFQERFGSVEFLQIPMPPEIEGLPSGMFRIALAYIKEVMIEFVEVDTSKPSLYLDALPVAEAEIRLHHLGYLIDDHQAMLARLKQAGLDVPRAGSFGGVLEFSYADTRPQLGHYSEFIRLFPAGKEIYASVPRN